MTRYRFAAAAGVVAVTIAAAWSPAHPFYLTNDDVAMRLLVEGRFAPHAAPTAFVLFMHVAVGWLLSTLYTTAPGLPWYDSMMFMTAVAASAALVIVWTGSWTGPWFVRSLLLSLVFLTPLFATPQFSLVGMMCAAAGLTLLARARIVSQRDARPRAWLTLGTCLFLWGTLIRWEGAALLLCQATVSCLAADLAQREWNSRAMRRILAGAVIAGTLPLVAAITQIAAYQRTPGWQEFPEFNYTRGILTEYAGPEALSPELLAAVRARTGWSTNDLQLLRNWFFEDPAVFTLEKLRTASVVLRHDRARRVASHAGSAVVAAGSIFRETWAALLVVLAVRASAARPMRRLAGTLVLLAIFLGIASVVGVALKELPFRVYWPMLALAAGLAVNADVMEKPNALSTGCLLAAGVLLCLLASARWHQQRARDAEAREVAADVVAMDRLAPSLIIIHADALRWEYVWRPFRRAGFSRPFLGIGASAQTPPVQTALRKAGHADVVSAMCSNDRVMLIAQASLPQMLEVFMREHYARDVAFDVVFEGRTLTAWRCRSKD